MKMTPNELTNYISDNKFTLFEFEQCDQLDGEENGLLRLDLKFDRMLFQNIPPRIHLVCDAGHVTVCCVNYALVDNADDGRDGVRIVLVRSDGVKHVVRAKKMTKRLTT